MTDIESIRKALQEAGQAHLLQFVDAGQTTPEQTQTLLDQIQKLKLQELNTIFRELGLDQPASSSASSASSSKVEVDYSPISDVANVATSRAEDLKAWKQRGLTSIAGGKIAAVVLSGGQGTRLGFDGPKGMYNIGLPSGKSIFQIMAERILRLSRLAGGDKNIPFYIMTSPLNHQMTKDFFTKLHFFGLNEDEVIFFPQGTMPCFNFEGKILLESPGSIAQAPDGNGSIYQSLQATGALADMERRGIEAFHVFSVDNILIKVADPVFIGYCLSLGADCGNKVVWKAHAGEKVGVVVNKNGKPTVVEYSEMDQETKEKVDEQGKLIYGAGNICSHFFTIEFIRGKVLQNLDKVYHAARKTIPCMQFPDSEPIKPTRENGIKLEAFIFDVFPLSSKMVLLEMAREDEFAPIKDAPGGTGDTPKKARSMLSNEAKRWVIAAGGKLVEGGEGGKGEGKKVVEGEEVGGGEREEGCSEISPFVSYQGEGLRERVEGKEMVLPIRFLE